MRWEFGLGDGLDAEDADALVVEVIPHIVDAQQRGVGIALSLDIDAFGTGGLCIGETDVQTAAVDVERAIERHLVPTFCHLTDALRHL